MIELDALRALMAVLREGNVSHWDGWVPGWPQGTAAKFILAPEPPAARAEDPTPKMPGPRTLSDAEIDEKVLKHIKMHGPAAGRT